MCFATNYAQCVTRLTLNQESWINAIQQLQQLGILTNYANVIYHAIDP